MQSSISEVWLDVYKKQHHIVPTAHPGLACTKQTVSNFREMSLIFALAVILFSQNFHV